MSRRQREEMLEALCEAIEQRALERYAARGYANLIKLISPYIKRDRSITVVAALQQVEKEAVRTAHGFILDGRMSPTWSIEKGKLLREELMRSRRNYRNFLNQLVREAVEGEVAGRCRCDY